MVAVSVKLCHVSMQFSDSLLQHKEDAQAVFNYASKHNSWFVTGTEAGMTHNNHDLHDDLVAAAHRYNFAIYANRWGEWIGGNRKFLETFDRGYEGPFIRGTHGLTAEEGGHSPRGITWMSAHSKKYPKLGELTVGCSHFLTPKSMRISGSNQPLIEGIGRFGKFRGSGGNKCFFCADANMRDDKVDVFNGQPFTTIADELHKHPKTHGLDIRHGTVIDIIASYDNDQRVSAKAYHVADDSDLMLHTDHFLLEAVYSVQE